MLHLSFIFKGMFKRHWVWRCFFVGWRKRPGSNYYWFLTDCHRVFLKMLLYCLGKVCLLLLVLMDPTLKPYTRIIQLAITAFFKYGISISLRSGYLRFPYHSVTNSVGWRRENAGEGMTSACDISCQFIMTYYVPSLFSACTAAITCAFPLEAGGKKCNIFWKTSPVQLYASWWQLLHSMGFKLVLRKGEWCC